jgi:uncharacterized protein with von Willebrand factor type A (vWA) domain
MVTDHEPGHQEIVPADNADLWSDLEEEIRNAPDLPQQIIDGTAVISHDAFDHTAFIDAQEEYPSLGKMAQRFAGELVEQGKPKPKLDTAPALLRDVFIGFYRYNPTVVDAEEVKPSHLINRTMVEELTQTAEFKQLNISTAGDDLLTTIAAIGAADKMVNAVDKKMADKANKLAELEKKMEELGNQVETLDQMAEELAEEDPQKSKEMSQQAEQAEQQLGQVQEQAAKLGKQLQDGLDQLGNAVRRAVRPALQAAQEEIDDLNDAIKAFGGGFDPNISSQQARRITSGAKLALSQKIKNNRKLKNIAEITGRFVRIAVQTQKSKVEQPPDEVVGIKTGQDIPHLLPVEMGLLANPELKPMFYHKFAESKLLEYELHKKENMGKGPIIVALDESSSMTAGAMNGLTREEWSKGCTIALMTIARMQKRDIAIIHFSSDPYVRVDVFKKGQATSEQVMDMAEYFQGGGTVYDLWMKKAIALVGESRFNKADVIIVSDGDVRIPSNQEIEWNKLRKDREMRCHSILIGTSWGEAALKQISDTVVTMYELTDQKAESEAMGAMFSI